MFEDFLEESWSYQEMVQKGLDKGIEIGELKALRPTLVRIVEKRFPELTTLARQQAERFAVPELLNDVIDKLLSAQTVNKARQILTELDQVPDTPHPDA